VPFKKLAIRTFLRPVRDPKPAAIELIVVFTVVEVFFQPLAHPDAMFGGDRDVPLIEEGVHVRTHQDAIVYSVLAGLCDRADMRGLKYRKGLLSRHRAAPFIGFGDDHAEASLTKSLANQRRATPHWRVGFRNNQPRIGSETLFDGRPDGKSRSRRCVIALPLLNMPRELRGNGNPQISSEKKGSIRTMHPTVKLSRGSSPTLRYFAIRSLISSSDEAPFFSPNASQASSTGKGE